MPALPYIVTKRYICNLVAFRMEEKYRTKADLIGMAVAILCAIHCSILPIAIAYGVISSSTQLDHSIVEYLFLILSISIAFISLWYSYKKKHKNAMPLIIASIGFIIFLLGMANIAGLHILMTTSGGILIALSHFVNWRISHK